MVVQAYGESVGVAWPSTGRLVDMAYGDGAIDSKMRHKSPIADLILYNGTALVYAEKRRCSYLTS